MNEDRLAIALTHADGSESRIHPDAIDPGKIPGDISTTTAVVSGFETMTCPLLRDMREDRRDLNLLDRVEVYAPGFGNETVWEGRQNYFPATIGKEATVTPEAIGLAAALEDNPQREIFVSSDFSRWRGAGLGRQLEILASNWSHWTDPKVSPDSVGLEPALTLEIIGAMQAAPLLSESEAWFDSQGIPIEAVQYDWQETVATINITGGATSWTLTVSLCANDQPATLGDYQTSANLMAFGATSRQGDYVANAGNRVFVLVQLRYDVAGGAADQHYAVHLHKIPVFGRHGLTKRGTSPGQGFYASDVIRHVVDRYCEGLSWDPDSKETSYPIPDLAFFSRTTPGDMAAKVNLYHREDYGVWEGGRLRYGTLPAAGNTWTLKLRDGVEFEPLGETADELYDRVYVIYRDAAGSEYEVGPSQSARLLDTDPDNPCVSHGQPRGGVLKVDPVTNLEGAIAIGEAWLRPRTRPAYRGQATVSGWPEHDQRGARPPWGPRATQWFAMPDLDGVPRKIVKSAYNRRKGATVLDLDNRSHSIEALLERLGVEQVNIV